LTKFDNMEPGHFGDDCGSDGLIGALIVPN
jgi:hypothetical protein